jgi:hypothetical protein
MKAAREMNSFVSTVTLLYLMCFMDRTNIGTSQSVLRRIAHAKLTFVGNARLAGIEKNLRLKVYDYNTAFSSSIYHASFSSFLPRYAAK